MKVLRESKNSPKVSALTPCWNAVGTQESMMQAITATRPGGHVGYVGVPHGVELDGEQLFFRTSICTVDLLQCVATCLTSSSWFGTGRSTPERVFDLRLPLDQVAEGYAQWTSAVRLNVAVSAVRMPVEARLSQAIKSDRRSS